MAVRSEFATVEVPIVLRDRLAAMRIHPRQALHELIEDALDLWDDAQPRSAAASKSLIRRPELQGRVPTSRTKLRRMPSRGHHDRTTLDAILDEGFVCHVGFVEEDGSPVVIPTGYVRDGDRLLLHGSKASRMLRHLAAGKPVCVTVTLVDGLVLARSGFDHSMNYRSVVVFGRATPVPEGEKLDVLRTYMERLLPGRWDALRPTTAKELAATEVVTLPLDEASAKVRAGGVKDDPADAAWPVWAGVMPLRLVAGEPVTDPGSKHPVPSAIGSWSPERRG